MATSYQHLPDALYTHIASHLDERSLHALAQTSKSQRDAVQVALEQRHPRWMRKHHQQHSSYSALYALLERSSRQKGQGGVSLAQVRYTLQHWGNPSTAEWDRLLLLCAGGGNPSGDACPENLVRFLMRQRGANSPVSIHAQRLAWDPSFLHHALHTLQQRIVTARSSDDSTSTTSPFRLSPIESLLVDYRDENASPRLAAPIHFAAYSGNLAIIDALLEHGVLVGAKTHNGDAALHFAAAHGHTHIVARLLEHGANLDARNQQDRTPLLLAIWNRHPAVVQVLLDAGADALAADHRGVTPLMMAASLGSRRILEALLHHVSTLDVQHQQDQHHLYVNMRDDYGRTALWWASYFGHAKTVQRLHRQGALVNVRSRYGSTPLYVAAHHHQTEVVRVLLELGANCNIPLLNGWTPLMIAAARGDLEIVRMLLERGAEVSYRNEAGKSAVDLAQSRELRILLEQAWNKAVE